ncbi:hypothetical protein SD427_05215 [Chryseobacterium sp. JJR-5R]|uniref:hypothetical protein n=1 Tax=Chryseobacterium sp. JJR-5R TaxID=3093923 RepID=UPI002A75C1F6|nr:hypothetical protein [Chryseobacterium sp. JJR-5R]WPO83731.1 hypothetical protein SD427_05215 [Chryseobacterium sp. JJR-5R]
MTKQFTALLGLFFAATLNSQVGIGTTTPTRTLDVNGSFRLRTTSDEATNTNYARVLVQNSNTGDVDYKEGDPVPAATGVTTDASTSMFVIRRYLVGDFPVGIVGGGFDTGMTCAKWEAVVSNIRYTYSIQNVNNQFPTDASVPNSERQFGYMARSVDGGNWRITGDIYNLNESNVTVDVLFINKKYVAADNRTDISNP